MYRKRLYLKIDLRSATPLKRSTVFFILALPSHHASRVIKKYDILKGKTPKTSEQGDGEATLMFMYKYTTLCIKGCLDWPITGGTATWINGYKAPQQGGVRSDCKERLCNP